jgi:hypothetical protein
MNEPVPQVNEPLDTWFKRNGKTLFEMIERSIDFTCCFDEREEKAIVEISKRRGISLKATVRYLVRLGQMVDYYMTQGFEIGFRSPDSGELTYPFRSENKMAPPTLYRYECICGRSDGCTQACKDYNERTAK